MHSLFVLLSIIILLLSPLAYAILIDAPDIHVSIETGIDSPDCGNSSTPCRTLGSAIGRLPANIYVSSGIYYGAENAMLLISSDCVIIGNGTQSTIIDLSGNTTFFLSASTSNYLGIKQLTITGANTEHVISTYGVKLYIEDIIFINNTADSLIFIIYAESASILKSIVTQNTGLVTLISGVRNVTFSKFNITHSKNSSSLVFEFGTLSITNSVFLNNEHEFELFSIFGNATTISDCEFQNNYCTTSSDAFCSAAAVSAFTSFVSVTNTKFINNIRESFDSVQENAGALFISNGGNNTVNVALDSVLFKDNSNFGAISNCAGALSIQGGEGYMSNCTFTNNTGVTARIYFPHGLAIIDSDFSDPQLYSQITPSTLLWLGSAHVYFENEEYVTSVFIVNSSFSFSHSAYDNLLAIDIFNSLSPQMDVFVSDSIINGSSTTSPVMMVAGNETSPVTVSITSTEINPDITCNSTVDIWLSSSVTITHPNCELAKLCGWHGPGACLLCPSLFCNSIIPPTNNTLMVAIVSSVSVFAVACFITIIIYFRRKNNGIQYKKVPEIAYEEDYQLAPESINVGNLGHTTFFSPNFNSCLISDVKIGAKIGFGEFGVVFDGSWHGMKVAMKTLVNEYNADLISEAILLKELRHPNIVQFFGIYRSSTNESYLVTEFVEGGNLEYLLRNKPNIFINKDLIRIALDITSGMIYLEQKGIIHRDLAARNILIEAQSFTAKVSDFGMSKLAQQYYIASRSVFPIKWASPEVILFNKFSSKSDVWAMGIVLWEIITFGKVPYCSMTNKEASAWVLSGNRLDIPPNTSPMLSSLISNCWLHDPHLRPTFAEIFNILTEVLKETSQNVTDPEENIH